MMSQQRRMGPAPFPSAKLSKVRFYGLIRRLDRGTYLSSLGILIVVVLLWAPFGLKTTDLADGWINLRFVEGKSLASLLASIFTSTPRPLVYVPWKLASLIDQDSFRGVQLLFALTFWGKGIVFSAILRRLRLASSAPAFLVAILYILYPADQGNFLLAAFSRHVAVFFYLLAVLFLVLSSQRTSATYPLAMMAATAVTGLISEQGFLLLLVTPALLLGEKECPGSRKRLIAALWYGTFILTVVDFLLAVKPYQASLIQTGEGDRHLVYIYEILASNLLAYWRVLLDGWLIAWQGFQALQLKYLFLALLMTMLAGILAYSLSRWSTEQQLQTHRTYRLPTVLLAGLAVIGLSFFPYSITSFRYKDYRVFYFAAIGGALIIASMYSWISGKFPRWRKALDVMTWGVIIFTVSSNALAQHARFVARSRIQQETLTALAEQAPAIKRNTILVLINENMMQSTTGTSLPVAGFLDEMPFKVNLHFTNAARWLYDEQSIRAYECRLAPDCSAIPYPRAVLFRYTEDQKLTLLDKVPAELQQQPGAEDYAPYKRISYFPFPRRAKVAFDITPEPEHLAPIAWTGHGQSLYDRRVCGPAHSESCSLLFYKDGSPTIFQAPVQLSGETGERLELSVWGRAEHSLKTSLSLISITVNYADGTSDQFELSAQLLETWTIQVLSFDARQSYVSLLVELHPNTTAGLVWLDDVRLSRDGSAVPLPNGSFEK